MSRHYSWILATAVAVTVSIAPSQRARAAPAWAEQYAICSRLLARDPQYAEIAKKLPLMLNQDISLEMLADQTRPTPIQREEIASWFDERTKCWHENEDTFRRSLPVAAFEVLTEANSQFESIGADLYNLKLSYGQADKRLREINDNMTARLRQIFEKQKEAMVAQRAADEQRQQQQQDAELLRQAQQRAAAAQARATEDAEADRQAMLRQLRALQPRAQQSFTCTTFGNMTTCN